MAEALSFSDAGAARELAAAQRAAARGPQAQPLAAPAEEERAELESEEDQTQAARTLAAGRRTAARRTGAGGGAQNVVAEITDTAGEIVDLVTAAVEIEVVVPALALLANYHVRFISGNMGVMQEMGGPASKFLDLLMDIASAGAKTAAKTGTATAKTAGASAAGTAAASPFEVKKLAIWQIFLMVVIDMVLVFSIVVNLLLLFALPLLVAGGIAGIVIGFCSGFQGFCTFLAEVF